MTSPWRGPFSGPERRPRLTRPVASTASGFDPGLQPERTTLSWSRTLLAFITVSALCLRWTPQFGLVTLWVPALALVAALAIGATQRGRTVRSVRGIQDEQSVVDWAPKAALVLVMLALAGICLALVLLGAEQPVPGS